MRNWVLLTAGLGVLWPVAPLEAQGLTFGVAGGVSVPVGDFSDGVDLGWNAVGTLWLSSIMHPLSLRVDGAHNQFGFSDDAGVEVDGTARVTSGTLNAAYRLPMTNSPISPYLMSGLGAYHSDCSEDACEGTTKFGWNVGLGTRIYLLGFRSFLEARYHRTERGDSDVHFISVSVGPMF
ncbi:MAG: outer membrane beta-barrel protein [Longimicrobiales bacterium]